MESLFVVVLLLSAVLFEIVIQHRPTDRAWVSDLEPTTIQLQRKREGHTRQEAPLTVTNFVVIHLRKDPQSQDNTVIRTLQVAVALALTKAAGSRIHNPPPPYDIHNLQKALIVEDAGKLDQIQRHINPASGHRDPRIYLIRGQEDRIVIASDKDDDLILCEMDIEPEFIGQPDTEDGQNWSRFQKDFGWVDLCLFDHEGRGLRQWFDESKVEYLECDSGQEPWEAEVEDETTVTEPWEAGG
ncbi:hypothetical protein DOTSEDRAFT_57659 [Dothistroma septosporum NZE10]|uniref:Uncharacterized protein n=1 Tax=Dothistroma septosporum (strain NZE10 / CBS 128990) TaxID=675120 RepID=M2YHR4_DOTSN|nr:hypothetical protein DOTSEDRAFT_57659 [Dothistroma septosporum NZE10]